MNTWLPLLILGVECVLLDLLYIRAIGWKPRRRWEAELKQRELERRIEQLEHRIELLRDRERLSGQLVV